MDKLAQYRRLRLGALIKTAYKGSQRVFADAAGLSEGRVSQLLDDDQPFGEKVAKRIGIRLGLGERFFEDGFTGEVPTAGAVKLESIPHLVVWPFDAVDFQKVSKLSPVQLSRLQGALLSAAGKFGLEIQHDGPVVDPGATPLEGGVDSPTLPADSPGSSFDVPGYLQGFNAAVQRKEEPGRRSKKGR